MSVTTNLGLPTSCDLTTAPAAYPLMKTGACTSKDILPIVATNPDQMTFFLVVDSTDLYYIRSRLRHSNCPLSPSFNWFGYDENSSNCSALTPTPVQILLVPIENRKIFRVAQATQTVLL